MGGDYLTFERYFTSNDKDVSDMFQWEKRDVDIRDDSNVKLFTQKDVEFPSRWSKLAGTITASKYFYGRPGERESSAKQLVGRVSETFGDWALKGNYFDPETVKSFQDEIAYLTLSQKMAFNSPVWFNMGIDKIDKTKSGQKEYFVIDDKGKVIVMPCGEDKKFPQTSACFIQYVEDTMGGIMDLAKNEALLFKYGSGTGTNLSTLRSSFELLSSGGKPSGPLAYWKFYDDVAGIVKSGGKTRRAAKMDILNVWHPDILKFIESKKREEEKKHMLISAGMNHAEANESVAYQNTNISVRVNDEFMEAVEEGKEWKTIPVHSVEMADQMPKYKAKDLMRKIAEGTYFCGDPGMQYDDTINQWHTCKNSGKINASNPCSEYMFLDDSACNLASLNLFKFLNSEGVFDVESFSQAIKVTAIAQDLEIDNSSYPTKNIAENSHSFRPLGMGYANLGSMLMYLGLPYDSDEARASAGAITALLTGKVYETSTEMAEKIGVFDKFEMNKEPMLEVMKMHKDALNRIDRSKLPKGLEGILDEAEKTWDNVLERGEQYGFRNAQATVLAPTGTIARMMDCGTLGIEPEIGLVQIKKLTDGGILRIVNNTVKFSLERLGYEIEEVDRIIKYVEENETIEGSGIKEEHLAIFDCALKPKVGKRTISPQGHLEMMAAVQPFLSGAISKTVNLPGEATVEDIENVYIDAWKMGLKSVALYRDNSKVLQPMNFTEEKVHEPVRKKLPITSKSIRHKFSLGGGMDSRGEMVSHEGYLHVGLYENGKPGEVFITMNKEGSTIGGLMDAFATSISMNLQYGVPLKTLVNKFRHQRFEPSGMVWEGHSEIKTADSLTDYIFNFMDKEFLGNGDKENGLEEEVKVVDKKKVSVSRVESNEELGGLCPVCGTQMVKKGHCDELCPNCNFLEQKGCGQ